MTDQPPVSPTLLACPFCGGPADTSFYHTESKWSHNEVKFTSVGCDHCNFSMSSEPGEEPDAITAWNTRLPAPPRDLNVGRFTEWPTPELAAQCRMQSRDNLDPEYSQFMAAVADRLSAIAPGGVDRDEIADIINEHVSSPQFFGDDQLLENHRQDQLAAADAILSLLQAPAGGEAKLREALTLAANRMDVMALEIESAHPQSSKAYDALDWARAARAALSTVAALGGEGSK